MSKNKNGGLDQYDAGPLNNSNLEQLALKALNLDAACRLPTTLTLALIPHLENHFSSSHWLDADLWQVSLKSVY